MAQAESAPSSITRLELARNHVLSILCLVMLLFNWPIVSNQCFHLGPDFRTWVRIRTFLWKVVRKGSGFIVKVRIFSSGGWKPPNWHNSCLRWQSTGSAQKYIIESSRTIFSDISFKIPIWTMKCCSYTVKVGLFTKVRIWSSFCGTSPEKN